LSYVTSCLNINIPALKNGSGSHPHLGRRATVKVACYLNWYLQDRCHSCASL